MERKHARLPQEAALTPHCCDYLQLPSSSQCKLENVNSLAVPGEAPLHRRDMRDPSSSYWVKAVWSLGDSQDLCRAGVSSSPETRLAAHFSAEKEPKSEQGIDGLQARAEPLSPLQLSSLSPCLHRPWSRHFCDVASASDTRSVVQNSRAQKFKSWWAAGSLCPGAPALTSELSELVSEMMDLGTSQEEGDIGQTAEWRTSRHTERGHNSGTACPGKTRRLRLRWRRRCTQLAFGNKSDFKRRRDNVFASIESDLCDRKESSASVT